DRCTGATHSLQSAQQFSLSLDCWILHIGCIALLLDDAKLGLDQLEALIFPFKFTTQALGKRPALGGGQFAEINSSAPPLRLDPPNALGEEQPLDAVDMASTLSDQALALAMGTASVFLFDRGHPNNGANASLATVQRGGSPAHGERIGARGLHSARPSIDLDACRIEDVTVDPDLCQRTRQPETVVTRLITDHDPLLLPRGRSFAQSADQVSQISAADPMNARPIAIRTSDGNDPAL